MYRYDEAIQAELDRNGQIFYVVPKIQMMQDANARLQGIFPDLRIMAGHFTKYFRPSLVFVLFFLSFLSPSPPSYWCQYLPPTKPRGFCFSLHQSGLAPAAATET